MFGIIKDWREQRILEQSQFTNADWQLVAEQIPILKRLTEAELAHLFELATLFLPLRYISYLRQNKTPAIF